MFALITDAQANQIINAITNPTFIASVSGLIAAVGALIMGIANHYSGKANHQEQITKLDTIKADVNSNLTETKNDLKTATSQLAETHATIASLVAAQKQPDKL